MEKNLGQFKALCFISQNEHLTIAALTLVTPIRKNSTYNTYNNEIMTIMKNATKRITIHNPTRLCEIKIRIATYCCFKIQMTKHRDSYVMLEEI